MLVFVDESGDTGLKFEEGSSERFALTLVIFQQELEAQRVEERIARLRQELRKGSDYEFHFKKNSDSIREAFLRAVSPFHFTYMAFIIDKAGFYGSDKQSRNRRYAEICGLVFEAARPDLREALVKIDRSGGQDLRRELIQTLKHSVHDFATSITHIKRVEMADSQSNDLLQLADMICGAVARSVRPDKKEAGKFRDIIRHREQWLRFLPEERG